MVKALQERGHSAEDMQILGLAKQSTKTKDYYSFFRDRVMFPVADRRGRIIAFGGRILPDHMRAPDRGDFTPPKYLNSPETPIFDKGRVLYGEDKARIAARDLKPLIVTEGYMDVIACHQAGFNGAVAPMGTALTEGQIDKLWKMIPQEIKQPVLCFDGDNAGQKAAARACERALPLLQPGQSVSFAFLPQGEDPDSLIAGKGRAAFEEVLNKSIPLIDYLWRLHVDSKPQRTPEEKAAIASTLRKQVFAIEDVEVQKHYKAQIEQKITDYFYTPARRSGQGWGNKRQQGGWKYNNKPVALPVRPASRAMKNLSEKILLTALLNYPRIFDHVEEKYHHADSKSLPMIN